MQYILSQEEYDELVLSAQEHHGQETVTINQLCQLVADHMPISGGHATQYPVGGDPVKGKAPWRCIHSIKSEWYCDNCPVKEACRNNKHWSK